jgi:probable phosphoglycerate mutase
MIATQKVLHIRHGETEWSLRGQHTGTTDIPLKEYDRAVAKLLKPVFAEETVALVLPSPLWRAEETCDLAGSATALRLNAIWLSGITAYTRD